jgi:hypothetical protein
MANRLFWGRIEEADPLLAMPPVATTTFPSVAPYRLHPSVVYRAYRRSSGSAIRVLTLMHCRMDVSAKPCLPAREQSWKGADAPHSTLQMEP